MHTQCNPEQLEFSCVARRRVVAAFDGGLACPDGGALLLKRTDEAIGLFDRLARCFVDGRQASQAAGRIDAESGSGRNRRDGGDSGTHYARGSGDCP